MSHSYLILWLAKSISISFGFLLTLILSRFYSVEEFGLFSFIFATIALSSVVSLSGVGTYLIKKSADPKSIFMEQYQQSKNLSLLQSIFVCFLLTLLFLYNGKNDIINYLFLIIPLTYSRIHASLLIASNKKNLALIFDPNGIQILIVVFVYMFYHYASLPQIYACSVLLIFVFCIIREKFTFSTSIPSMTAIREITILGINNTLFQAIKFLDIILLGIFATLSEVGTFRVAAQIALLLSVPLQIQGLYFNTQIARAKKMGNLSDVVYSMRRSNRLISLFVTLIYINLIIFGDGLIQILFGINFIGATDTLIILSFGSLISTYSGNVGMMCALLQLQNSSFRILVFALLAYSFAIIIISPTSATQIAVISTLITISVNILMSIVLKRKLNIRVSV